MQGSNTRASKARRLCSQPRAFDLTFCNLPYKISLSPSSDYSDRTFLGLSGGLLIFISSPCRGGMFDFSYLCDFLEKAQSISLRDPPLSLEEKHDLTAAETALWFKSYRRAIDSLDSGEASALLSALLPHKRKDRIYGLQSTSLAKVLGRCLGLSASKRRDLSIYNSPGRSGDLADCLERVLQGGGPPALPPVTLLEIDDLLQRLAGHSRFSSLHLQSRLESSDQVGRLEHAQRFTCRLQDTQRPFPRISQSA